ASETLDGLAVQQVGGRAVTHQRLRPRLDAERPVRAAGACSFLESLQGRSGLPVGAASNPRLDDFREAPTEESQVLVLASRLCAGQGVLVAAETIAEHRGRVPC